MNYNLDQQDKKAVPVRRLLTGVLVLGCAFGAATSAMAQNVNAPTAPAIITPPAGHAAFMSGRAVGTQGYTCLPTTTGASTASWTVNGARPEATVFTTLFGQDVQVITHFLSTDTNPNEVAPDPVPFGSVTWQSSFDSSKVWGQPVNSILAGSDTSCPNAGAISCVLLQSIGSLEGPAGGKTMTQTTFIQRLNTNGGSAPADGCVSASDVGKQKLVPYTADYYFFRKDQ